LARFLPWERCNHRSKEDTQVKTIVSVVLSGCMLAAGLSGEARAEDKAKVRAELSATGIDADASGAAKATIRTSSSKLKVIGRGLEPGDDYTLVAGGVPRAVVTATASGKVVVKLRQPATGTDDALDFDPRGKEVELRHGTDDVLGVVFSGPGEPSDIVVDDRTALAPTALGAGGRAEARYRKKDGRASFHVEVEDVAPGDYDLFVDGALRGAITVAAATGQGQLEFDTQPDGGEQLLDFDPRGLVVDVAQGGAVFFSGVMAAQAGGVNVCTFAETEETLTSTGADADATGKARFRVRDDCDQDFRVEIEDVAVGAYELRVGGVVVGTLDVVDTGTEIEGQLEFDSDADEAGELPLTFDPRGALVEVAQGATVYFSHTFGAGSGGGGSTCTPEETLGPIASTGVDPDGTAEARIRVQDDCDLDLRVQVEDVALGAYTLRVDGVDRGTITVVDNAGDPEGQIEFDTDADEPGELPLTFDPRGASFEIVQGATVFFSGTVGSGGGGGPAVCTPSEAELPLLSTGADADAKGKARYREEGDCGADFRVEIEDVAIGSYALRVAGEVVGSIAVTDTGTEIEGEIEFDTDPDEPGELPLGFDPRGALVEVVQGATVYLSREFPAS
jgi:hypothetical protein